MNPHTPTHTQLKPDLAEIRRALDVLIPDGAVFEIRSIDVPRHNGYGTETLSGYFDSREMGAIAVVKITNAPAIYTTLNPVHRALLSRAANRIRAMGKKDASTADTNIDYRQWLPIDCDPVRPSGISSSDEEHDLALERSREVRAFLASEGWPEGLAADSGNGGHSPYKTHLPANDEGLVSNFLKTLATLFDDGRVKIDQGVHNPARIWKLYGTPTRKGDNTPERPHRLSRLLYVPEHIEIVTEEMIKSFIAKHGQTDKLTYSLPSAKKPRNSREPFDIDDFTARHFPGATWKAWRAKGDGAKIMEPDHCAFDPSHTDGAFFIGQLANGALTAGCHHNGCAGKGWDELRELLEGLKPAYYKNGAGHTNGNHNGNSNDYLNGHEPTHISTQSDDEKNPPLTLEEIIANLKAPVEGDKKQVKLVYKRRASALIQNCVTLSEEEINEILLTLEELGVDTRSRDQWHSLIKKAQRDYQKEKTKAETKERYARRINPDLPLILVSGRNTKEITEEAHVALVQSNNANPRIFVRGGLLSRVRADERGHPIAEVLPREALSGVLDRTATYAATAIVNDVEVNKLVPVPQAMVADYDTLGEWPGIPPLIGITTAPTLAKDGTIETRTGYNPKTQTYYHDSTRLSLGDITPTSANVQAALSLIDEMLWDFPFVDEASKANTIATLLEPFVRSVIDGPVPLRVVDSPTPGSGKGLLINTISKVFLGDTPISITAGKDDDEWRKRLTAKLLTAPSHIVIDNIEGKLDSSDLASALTASVWGDRLLGSNAITEIPVHCIWIVNGNNVELSNEISRRSAHIRIDSGVEQPWTRDNFRHKDLIGWVGRNRDRLVTACLTLVNKWVADGMQPGTAHLGSYESWAGVVSGILDSINVPGFMGNATALYESKDTERGLWAALVNEWAGRYGTTEVKAGDLFSLASTPDDPSKPRGLDILAEVLGSGPERSRLTRLGNLLKKNVDRVFAGWQIRSAVDENGARKRKQGGALFRLSPTPTQNTLTSEPLGEPLSEEQGKSEPCEPATTRTYI